MSVTERRERERRERRELIVSSARRLAEAEGWDAVTTRRLAETVEYSQPVLYSHFRNKDAIVAAVAVDGFAELAEALRRARTRRGTPERALRSVLEAYLAFAGTLPATYDAMFSLPVGVRFAAGDETPEPLRRAFDELLAAVRPVHPAGDPGVLTEVMWSTLHGLVTLTRGGRLPQQQAAARTTALLELLTA